MLAAHPLRKSSILDFSFPSHSNTQAKPHVSLVYLPTESGKDDYYSSSTQKQSIETITTSRNTSVKQLSKLHADNNFLKSPSIIEMATVTSRFPHIINENDVACLSKVMSGSEINIYSDDCVQEIQLKIFPPSSSHHQQQQPPHCHTGSRCKYCGNEAEEANLLSIDVRQESVGGGGNSSNNNSTKSTSSTCGGGGSDNLRVNDDEGVECRGRSLQEQFSHIAFKRTNSILHISIGNSSKVTKRRRKKRQWLFTRLFNRKESHSPDGRSLNLSNLSKLNVINENMIICINKKTRQSPTATNDNENYQNQLRSILDGDLEYGANELDYYMNEIKMREMG